MLGRESALERSVYPEIYECSVCGTEVNLDEYFGNGEYVDLMRERKVCHECAFWIDKAERPEYGRAIADGHYFIVNPFVRRPYNRFCALGGKMVYGIRNDRTFFMTDNAWHQGKIPDRFRDILPDDCRLLSAVDYSRMHANNFICHSMGCFDRYECVRYKIELEKESGPYNEIPKDYVSGSEKCPSFITKHDIDTCLRF